MTEVAGGKHVVPAGVAVEVLDGGKKKLSDECPPTVANLLETRGAKLVYDKMVAAICEAGSTRNVFGKWKDEEFVSIMDLFREDFADHGVKVVLCKRTSGSGTHRWLEFIDVAKTQNYVPQFDVSNMSGQVIKTVYTTIEFPNGVAVEKIRQYNGRKKLKEKIPVYVEKLLSDNDLMVEYEMLIEDILQKGTGKCGWNLDALKQVIGEHRPKFERKNITLFLSMKQEYVSHGQYGGHMEYFRWIEFVDMKEQPNYEPQRDAQDKKEQCVVM